MSLKTRWKVLGISVVLLVGVTLVTRGFGLDLGARSLVCTEDDSPSDVLLIDNLESNYLLFEKAEQLVREGKANRVLAFVATSRDREHPGRVAQGIVDLMAQVARVKNLETVPVLEQEPISLNAAKQVKAYLEGSGTHSLLVVTPGFRSRRSVLVYNHVFAPAGVTVRCVPVFGLQTPDNWRTTWHGFEEVFLQFGKLWYYRLAVL